MAVRTFSTYTTPKHGVLFGLTIPQLVAVAVASLPMWGALSAGLWFAGLLWLVGWLLLLGLVAVPLGGRSAVGWLITVTLFSVAGLGRWLTFRSKASLGTVRRLDALDMPGALSSVEVLDGPPSGIQQRRIAIIKHGAARTWAITAEIVHDGVAMADDQTLDRYAQGLTALIDAAARAELITELHLTVRANPDDCTERELWLREHLADGAPVTSVAAQLEHLRWSQAGVRTEAFLTLVVPESRLGKETRERGAGLTGRMNTLLMLAGEIQAVVIGAMGATRVIWLTSPELAKVVRLGFAPGDRTGLIQAETEARQRSGVMTGVPWALAGPSGAHAAVRHYAHDAWHTITSTVRLPDRGAAFGAWAAVLTPTDPAERRCLTVVFPIEQQSAADRKAEAQEFGSSLGQGLKERLGLRLGAKDRHRQAKIDQAEVQLALGAAMTHPYALCATTIPASAPVTEFGRRLDAAIRRGGMAPQRLDMAQDVAFVAGVLPLGLSLGGGQR